MRLLLRNGRILDPSRNLDTTGDVLLGDERILSVGSAITDHQADEIIDCTGLWICPGLIDIHVHLREPGGEHKETVITGTRAAAAGGFTTICCMPNTKPPLDEPHLLVGLREKMFDTESAGVAVEPICSLTRGMDGTHLTDLSALQEAGAVAASDDAYPLQDSEVMRRAMEYCKMLDLPIITHCEDMALSNGGHMNAGYYSTVLGLKGMPREAEEVHIARNCILCLYTECRTHIAHVSTWGGVEIIRRAKALGANVTAEVNPHHFILTDKAVGEYNTNAKMNPPLRTQRDIEALIEGLEDGTIDCISSDHAPHAAFEKETTFDNAPYGIVGLETMVGLTLTYLTQKNHLSPLETIRKLSTAPANILDLSGGTLRTDNLTLSQVTVIDPEHEWVVDAAAFRSKSKNTPFHGWNLKGLPVLTIWNDVLYRHPRMLK